MMDDMQQACVRLYSLAPEVSELWSNGRILWVFTNEPKYDGALMDRLLTVELHLSERDNIAPVEYVPLVLAKPDEIVAYGSTQIYAREVQS